MLMSEYPIPPDLASFHRQLQNKMVEQKHFENILPDSGERYRYAFEKASFSLWEKDFSAIKSAIDNLKSQGITDFRKYLEEKPEFIIQAFQMIKVKDVNEATLKLYEAKNKKGLSELLSGKASLDEALVDTKIQNLSVITSGEHIPNSADFLSSEKFREIISELKTKFQKIIIDVPAIMPFTDFMFWAHESDLLLMAIKSGATSFDIIEKAKNKLAGKISFKGAVLNKTAVESDMKYYKHYFKTVAGKAKKKIKK